MVVNEAKTCQRVFRFCVSTPGEVLGVVWWFGEISGFAKKLADRLDSWFVQHGYDDLSVTATLQSKAALFVEGLVRSEFPKSQSRVEKEKELRAKRDKAMLDASEKLQGMEVKDVLSPALFELAKLGGARKPVKIKSDSALAYLVQDKPELQKKYNVKIAAPDVEIPERLPRKPNQNVQELHGLVVVHVIVQVPGAHPFWSQIAIPAVEALVLQVLARTSRSDFQKREAKARARENRSRKENENS